MIDETYMIHRGPNEEPDRFYAGIGRGPYSFGPALTDDHPLQQALDVGQKVLAFAGEGRVVDIDHGFCGERSRGGNGHKYDTVEITIKPAPSKGLKWLMSLPDGERRVGPSGARFVKMPDGIHFVGNTVWLWEETSKYSLAEWVKNACPEACPTWKPEEAGKENTDA